MTALTNDQRRLISEWLDNRVEQYRLALAVFPSTSQVTTYRSKAEGYAEHLPRTIDVMREKVTYRNGYWQYYAADPNGEPLVFGKMRQGPTPPRPHVQRLSEQMRGVNLTEEEAVYLRNTISSRTRLP